jgi:hypothetical protein
MPPSFCRVWKEIGVSKWTWDVRPTLMVPLQRPTLVLLRNPGGHLPTLGPGLSVTRIDKAGLNVAIDRYLSGFDLVGSRRSDLFGELLAALLLEMGIGSVLLSVAARHAGSTWLKAGSFRQDAYVSHPLVSEIAFKFLHYPDDSGNVLPVTHKDHAFAPEWIADLDWILGGQANVWFELVKAEPVRIERQLGSPLDDVTFRNYVAPHKDPWADVTVFLVGKWKGSGAAGGTFFTDLGDVIALADKPAIPVVPGNDPFIVTLAHELVHYVLNHRGNKMNIHHLPDQHALLNRLVESTVVTPLLQQALNPG